MSKTYDCVEWELLRATLTKLGFTAKNVNLFMTCVTSARYQISHDGRKFNAIVPQRGLRQGDPLSSNLFLICIEGFISLIQEDDNKNLIKRIQVNWGAHSLSHMFFADDSYIYYKTNIGSSIHIIEMLHTFKKVSGQKKC